MGKGEGGGQDTGFLGGILFCLILIGLLVFGLPITIGGAVLLGLYSDVQGYFIAGIVLTVIGCLLLVGVIGVLIVGCGCCYYCFHCDCDCQKPDIRFEEHFNRDKGNLVIVEFGKDIYIAWLGEEEEKIVYSKVAIGAKENSKDFSLQKDMLTLDLYQKYNPPDMSTIIGTFAKSLYSIEEDKVEVVDSTEFINFILASISD